MDGDFTFTPDSKAGTFLETVMDLDFMDELLDDGCLLEAFGEINSLQPGPSSSSYVIEPPHYFPLTSGNPNDNSQRFSFVDSSIGSRKDIHPELIHAPENPPQDDPNIGEHVENEPQSQGAVENGSSAVQPKSFSVAGGELGKRHWIGPKASPGPSSSVKERLKFAIRQLKECTKDRDVLIQIWVPTKRGGKKVLTTINQPYLLDPKCKNLARYRNVSKDYHFLAEEGSKESVGFPGRVFLRKLPEWTPDVRFFGSDEYPRKIHAKQYNIGGSLAAPVFEQGSCTCLGVVEVITTTQQINYRPDLESLCKALEAVDLRSSQDFCPPSVKACKEFCKAAVPEISEILGSVCKKFGLPLALTWAPCFRQGKGGCRHFDENYAHCIATVDSACFVADRDLLRFHVACSEQYLTLGQGIVGRAFQINKQCFATDITALRKTDYPFSHHAKIMGLCAAIAIPLKSTSAGSVDFVLELFLPEHCQDREEQRLMENLLPIATQEVCWSLYVVMDKELEEDVNKQRRAASNGKEEILEFSFTSPKEQSPKEISWVAQMIEAQQKGEGVCVSWECLKEEPKDEFKLTTDWDNTQEEPYREQVLFEQHEQFSGPKDPIESGKASSGHNSSGSSRKTGEKRRSKAEKTISLQVLQHYFAGSLKDAAKSIGVCPTTLKRICRQHGVTRWPSRKIKKVGHSLKKLQLVIDSVQGVEGSIQLGSFYNTFPELTSPKFLLNGHFSSLEMNGDSKHKMPQLEKGIISAGATLSKSPSSSSSQSSGSSKYCSRGAKKHTTANDALSVGDALIVEESGGLLKRTFSDAELHAMNQEEPKFLIKSQSHKMLGNHSSPETHPISHMEFFKVKASYGEDKIRFSLQPNWGLRDLRQEIMKRFNIDSTCTVNLKYLDDDHEWILLTCDDDLKECKDICGSSRSHSIKISIHQASQPRFVRFIQ